MKKPFIRSISVFLAVWLLLASPLAGGSTAVHAEEQEDEPFRSGVLVVDETDEEGNYLAPYWIDEDGTRSEIGSQVECVRAAASLPSSYDLRSSGYVTPVKNQSPTGACWAFAMISCLESSMIKQGYGTASSTDYSEAHLVWFAQRQRVTDKNDPTYGDGKQRSNPFATGGNMFDASSAIMRGSGIQLESNARWVKSADKDAAKRDMEQPESSRFDCYGRLYESRWISDNSITDAKTKLMENGNLRLSYYDDDGDGWNASNACYYQNQTTSTNHAVAVVGWDDNFSRTKFNSGMRPSSNGAWLVKGSWGTNYGNDGYYWISYYDKSISYMFSMIAKPASLYDNIYQYNASDSDRSFYDDGTIYAANRFRSTKNEKLTHVSFESRNTERVNAKVEVYVAGSGYSVPSSTDPTTNMSLVSAATTTLNGIEGGFYTVTLNRPVNVSGRYFTVVVTFTNPSGGRVRAAVEGLDGDDEEKTYSAKSGQSFIALSDKTWRDCTSINEKNYHNTTIKAMTQNMADEPDNGTWTVTPENVSFEVNQSATITCAHSGFSSHASVKPKWYHVGGDDIVEGTWGKWNNHQITMTITASQPGTEKLAYALLDSDTEEELARQNVTVTVTKSATPHYEDSTFTVTPTSLSFDTGSSASVTCAFSGFTDHEWIGIYWDHVGGDEIVSGTWSKWNNQQCSLTLSSSQSGSETIVFVLYDDETDEELARQTVNVTVNPRQPTFFDLLWSIISFPFRIILFPFKLLFGLL